MDIFILAGQSNMAGRGGVFRSPDGKKIFQQDPSFSELIKDGELCSSSHVNGTAAASYAINFSSARTECHTSPAIRYFAL